MPKLTKKLIDSLSADEGGDDFFLWDTEVKGFGLRVSPGGNKSFVLKYRIGPRTRRYTISKVGSPYTVEQARDKARDLLTDIRDGKDPMDAKAEANAAMTVGELVKLYLAEGPAEKPNKKPQSWKADESNLLRHVVPLLGKKLVKALTQADVKKFQADVAAGKSRTVQKTKARGKAVVDGGKGTAARTVAVLAAMMQFAVNRRMLTENPAKGVELFKGEKRERFLSEREVALLADTLTTMEEEGAFDPTMAAAVRLLMLTGCRKNEILTLEWPWVDFDRGCLRLPDSKTGAKVVPLAAAALSILSDLADNRSAVKPEDRSRFVLPALRGAEGHLVGLNKAWDRLRIRATETGRAQAAERGEPVDMAPDLSTVRIHDLRHSFASFAVADGATLFMVGKVLGHKQARTTEVYAHLADDPLRQVAERTASRIADAMKLGTSRPAGEVVPLPVKGRTG